MHGQGTVILEGPGDDGRPVAFDRHEGGADRVSRQFRTHAASLHNLEFDRIQRNNSHIGVPGQAGGALLPGGSRRGGDPVLESARKIEDAEIEIAVGRAGERVRNRVHDAALYVVERGLVSALVEDDFPIVLVVRMPSVAVPVIGVGPAPALTPVGISRILHIGAVLLLDGPLRSSHPLVIGPVVIGSVLDPELNIGVTGISKTLGGNHLDVVGGIGVQSILHFRTQIAFGDVIVGYVGEVGSGARIRVGVQHLAVEDLVVDLEMTEPGPTGGAAVVKPHPRRQLRVRGDAQGGAVPSPVIVVGVRRVRGGLVVTRVPAPVQESGEIADPDREGRGQHF